MASDEVLQAINKHAMGDRSEFDALKERFTSVHYMPGPAAAALAYLIAKDELEAEKEEEEEEPDVYDKVVVCLKVFRGTEVGAHATANRIFTLIYEWLDKSLAEKNYGLLSSIRRDIEELFLPFVIAKPKA
jgi:hypothetical protein